MVGIGSVTDTHFLYSGYPSNIAAKRNPRGYKTSEPLWKTLVWDLRQCGRGFFDCVDEHGVPWEAGSERALRAGNPICGGHINYYSLVLVSRILLIIINHY